MCVDVHNNILSYFTLCFYLSISLTFFPLQQYIALDVFVVFAFFSLSFQFLFIHFLLGSLSCKKNINEKKMKWGTKWYDERKKQQKDPMDYCCCWCYEKKFLVAFRIFHSLSLTQCHYLTFPFIIPPSYASTLLPLPLMLLFIVKQSFLFNNNKNNNEKIVPSHTVQLSSKRKTSFHSFHYCCYY